jgi:hypothetical protein
LFCNIKNYIQQIIRRLRFYKFLPWCDLCWINNA